jgi:peptide-methionine (S)-S-oxide reductase
MVDLPASWAVLALTSGCRKPTFHPIVTQASADVLGRTAPAPISVARSGIGDLSVLLRFKLTRGTEMRALILAIAVAGLSLSAPAKAETAIFAGGCFWCVEKDMDSIKGVTETISGYAGGTRENPTYTDHEGYVEAVKVEFDPAQVSYETLLRKFLRSIDVTDAGGQFCDRGFAYTTAVFTLSAEQKTVADRLVKEAEAALRKKIVTPVRPHTTFAKAEDYHQNYYQGDGRTLTRFGYVKQSDAYKAYRQGCGRDARVRAVWGKEAFPPADAGH